MKEVLMKLQGICIGLFLVLLISGCASGQTGQGSATDPTLLQVVRVNTNLYARQFPPLSKSIQNAVTAEQIYHTAYTLPAAPIRSCSPSTGDLIYRLYFYHGKTLLQEMDLWVWGCPFLWLSKTDGRDPNSAFLLLVKQALHLDSLVPSY